MKWFLKWFLKKKDAAKLLSMRISEWSDYSNHVTPID